MWHVDLPPFSFLENSSCAVPVNSRPMVRQAFACDIKRMDGSERHLALE
jgi:hypothetical protein